MHVLLVANPHARSGRNRPHIDAALEEFLARGVSAELIETEPQGATIAKLVAAIDGGPGDVVVGMGGDGTFREVAAGVVQASRTVSMGFLPSGTANDQGKSFGIPGGPQHLERNIEIVLAGHVRPIDAGRIRAVDADNVVRRDDLFFDSAGFGMHSAILVGRNRDRELVAKVPILGVLYRDQAVYVGATVREYLRSYVEPAAFMAEVIADGVTHHVEGVTDLIIKGTPVYGGLWIPARHGEPDDGKFDLVPLRGRTDMLAKLVRDWKDLPVDPEPFDWLGLTYEGGLSASEYDIELFLPNGEPVPAQIDGEEWTAGVRFLISVLPRALPLIVPANWSAPWS